MEFTGSMVTELATYKWYISGICCHLGDYIYIYITYHLLREPETALDNIDEQHQSIPKRCCLWDTTTWLAGNQVPESLLFLLGSDCLVISTNKINKTSTNFDKRLWVKIKVIQLMGSTWRTNSKEAAWRLSTIKLLSCNLWPLGEHWHSLADSPVGAEAKGGSHLEEKTLWWFPGLPIWSLSKSKLKAHEFQTLLTFHYPQDPCMVYLPTFGIKFHQT